MHIRKPQSSRLKTNPRGGQSWCWFALPVRCRWGSVSWFVKVLVQNGRGTRIRTWINGFKVRCAAIAPCPRTTKLILSHIRRETKVRHLKSIINQLKYECKSLNTDLLLVVISVIVWLGNSLTTNGILQNMLVDDRDAQQYPDHKK